MSIFTSQVGGVLASLSLAFTVALSGCTHHDHSKAHKEVAMTKDAQKVVEPLKSLARSAKGVSVRVYTGGCTDKSHFEWTKSQDTANKEPIELVLHRTQKDNCYAHIPEGIALDFSYDELGVAADAVFTIGNPVVMPGVDPDA